MYEDEQLKKLQQEIDSYRQCHIISMDEKIAENEDFALFIEDNELPYKDPHVHVCVDTTNTEYDGEPLRDYHWAKKYKSIFMIMLKDASRLLTYDNVEKDENHFYNLSNLVVIDENVDYSRVSLDEVNCICKMLNKHKYELWNKYKANQECEIREQIFWNEQNKLLNITEEE